MRVLLSEDDRRIYTVRLKNEADELFGNEYLMEYGVDIPDDLVKEFIEARDRFYALNRKLREFDK